MKLKGALAIGGMLSLLFVPQAIDYAHAAGPATGTAVAWTSDTYFDTFSSRSGILASDQGGTNSLVWQVFYANAPLSIPADSTNRLGWSAYQSGNNTVTFKVAVSSVDDTLGNFTNEYTFSGVSWPSYTAGTFNEQAAGTAVLIPAKRYFLIGTTGPFYRVVKTMGANRSAQIGGLNYFTALNTVYYGPNATGPSTGIPTALGGTTTGFNTLNGYSNVISLKIIATGAPALPSLSTPETPTVSSIGPTSALLSLPSTDSGAQSYIASLYASNGTTFLESRTVTSSQVTSGFTWTGLTLNTTYRVGLTAVGNQSSSTNSSMSPLRTFTTTKNPTSVTLTFSNTSATFNTQMTITAALTGSTSGKITFSSNGKRIPKCISKVVTTSTVTCDWKPATRGFSFISAVFEPASASHAGSTSSASILIFNRTVKR
jgi:hypothetical protein